MHPSQSELIEYALSTADERAAIVDVHEHVATCEQCRARIDFSEEWLRNIEAEITPRVIALQPMPSETPPEPVRLAADGSPAEPPPTEGLDNIATFYSEQPELVLKLMRDRQTGEKSLHLLGDADTTRNVMIRIADPPAEFLTDTAGTAPLGEHPLDNPDRLDWQVRLPDAVFALKPLTADPERVAAVREFDLESDERNCLHVEMQSHAEGVMLRLQLVRIDGRDDLTAARVIVSQGPLAKTTRTSSGQHCTVTGLKPDHPIDIRIFAD